MSLRLICVLSVTLWACGDDGGLNQLADAPVFPDDSDSDGVTDSADNCPNDSNADQADADGDGQGDVCDDDDDNDGVADAADNCPLVPNADQTNTDGDADGDACDGDADGDGVVDTADNCPVVANDQSDLDADGLGDACDPDDDNDTIVDTADNCPTVANTDQVDGNANGRGDACEGIAPSFEGFVKGGGIAATGKHWAARFLFVNAGTDEVLTQSVIELTTIPAGAVVRKASLYWTVIGVAFPTVTLNGTAVTGTEIGQTPDTCWTIGNNFMYRADVTAMVAGNGTYTLTNILSNPGNPTRGPDGQGASLVVLYVDPADPRINYVSINDGATDLGGPTVFDGFTVGVGFDKAIGINLVADGQPAGDDLQYEGTSVAPNGDAFPGADGGPSAMWDTRIDDITTIVQPGATTVTANVLPTGDCLAWSMSALVIENVNDTVVQKRTHVQPQRKVAKQVVRRVGRPMNGRLVR
ncbi:MAG: thrombospondin type 3 repeat-containing protein [Kofleriaceae bacterium]